MTRWFEDITVDEVFPLGRHSFSEEEIIRFGRLYDPQYFHVDPEAAKFSHFGGLVASVLTAFGLSSTGGFNPGHALGILGGGYGAAQVAITGADWLPAGWRGAEFLLLLGAAKLVATSFTIGTGGSAGDFGPSLVLGGLFGGPTERALGQADV